MYKILYTYLSEAKRVSISSAVTQSLSNKILFWSRVIVQYLSCKLKYVSSKEKIKLISILIISTDLCQFRKIEGDKEVFYFAMYVLREVFGVNQTKLGR